jgi:1-acyl-sn-glycerol-3-phosphate acyltransferase
VSIPTKTNVSSLSDLVKAAARAAVRAPTGLAWTMFLHHGFIRSRQYIRGPFRAMGVIGFWGKGLAKIMGVRFHEVNRREGPMGDVIIANHMGFLDIPVLLTYFPAVFIIKMEMRRVPYFGKALAHQGHVFVERGNKASARDATAGLVKVLEDGDRIIVFPEGGASPGAERKPFKVRSFAEAQRLGKRVELCVLDYVPDRSALAWDVKRGMIAQIIEIIGRHHTDVSVEFFPAEYVEGDPEAFAQRYREIAQGRLEQHDREREARAAAGGGAVADAAGGVAGTS